MAKKPFNKESEKSHNPADMPPALAAEYEALVQAMNTPTAPAADDRPAARPPTDTIQEEASDDLDDATATAAMDELLLAIRSSTTGRPLDDAERDAWLKETRQKLAAKRAKRGSKS